MADFAQLQDGIVQQVIVVNDSELLNENGVQQESLGISFCETILGGTWIQVFTDGKRKQFPFAGYTYDYENDVFIEPQPDPSAILNESFEWVLP